MCLRQRNLRLLVVVPSSVLGVAQTNDRQGQQADCYACFHTLFDGDAAAMLRMRRTACSAGRAERVRLSTKTESRPCPERVLFGGNLILLLWGACASKPKQHSRANQWLPERRVGCELSVHCGFARLGIQLDWNIEIAIGSPANFYGAA